MATWIVLRHGSNAANQSLCQTAVVGVVQARNKREAANKFAHSVTVYANQFLEFLPQSKAKRWQVQMARELYNPEDVVRGVLPDE